MGLGDLGFSLCHNSLPVFTMWHDNKIHGIRGYRNVSNQVEGYQVNMTTKNTSLQNLLNGTTSLYRIILSLNKIKH